MAHADHDGFRPIVDDAPGAAVRALVERPRPTGERIPTTAARVLAPTVDPPSIRDFMIFEDHVVNARAGSGTDVPPIWYQLPVFYFTNPASVLGPGDAVRRPRSCRALDFELEVACVIGDEASDLDPDDPAACDVIAGFTLMNDWSARDLQMAEMPGGLGPAKGKDFATSLGPWWVTPDELEHHSPGRWACELDVRVNGRRVGGGNLASAHYSWSQVLGRASADTRLRPGDVIGSGTVGTGCLLELRALGPKDDHPWLRAGDTVELRVGALGALTNTVAD